LAARIPWLAIRKPMPARRALVLKVIAFCIPLLAWAAVSYVPWVWHPQVKLSDRGGTSMYRVGDYIDKPDFAREQTRLVELGKPPMQGDSTNPIFLPAPHEVGQAIWTAFTTPPFRRGTPWLHERIGHSVRVLAMGFALAVVVAVPLGVVCGTFDLFSKLIEPFIDFMRYMPAPAFGALMVAIFALDDQPKVAIIFIGLFFNMLLVTANTVRTLDPALLEAAQTLGIRRHKLLTSVVIPGVLPTLYTDLRIALGFGWVYLTIAELIGSMSGITEFINQQGKFRNYPNVFVGIFTLGMLGFLTDQFLAMLSPILFPWTRTTSAYAWAAAPLRFARRVVVALGSPRSERIFDRAAKRNDALVAPSTQPVSSRKVPHVQSSPKEGSADVRIA
jgi:NitT/TauT family transport system permease protein